LESEVKIEQLLADDSFVAWIEENASPEEETVWAAWVAEDPAREQIVKEAQLLHRNIVFNKKQRPEVEAQLSRLHKAIENNKISKTQSFKKRLYPSFRNNNGYRNAAAIIVLLAVVLGVITLFQSDFFRSSRKEQPVSTYQTASTQYGQQERLTLADGSTIILNGNSSLKYPSKYTGGNLQIWLKGEAYFDVIHKTDRTFIIHVPGGVVRDLGTTFDINTYKKDATQVILVKGQVKVETRDTLGRHNGSYLMKSGELCRLSRQNGKIAVSDVEPNDYTAWTRHKLIFEKASLADVAHRIEHIYGVKVRFHDKNIKKLLISGSLPNNGLRVFINALEKLSHRSVTNTDGVITIGHRK
jgi:ferric-dicitrate binding protein FerR (iron transport regulator)